MQGNIFVNHWYSNKKYNHHGGLKFLSDAISKDPSFDIEQPVPLACKSTTRAKFRVDWHVEHTRTTSCRRRMKNDPVEYKLVRRSCAIDRYFPARELTSGASSIHHFSLRFPLQRMQSHFLITLYRIRAVVVFNIVRLIIVHRNHNGLRDWCRIAIYLRHLKGHAVASVFHSLFTRQSKNLLLDPDESWKKNKIISRLLDVYYHSVSRELLKLLYTWVLSED